MTTTPASALALDKAATTKRVPRKPNLDGRGLSHPARFGNALLPLLAELLAEHCTTGRLVLDPFAGTGRIHELQPEWQTLGVEIEPEWAALHPATRVGNALNLDFADDTFDAVATSPCYGNRLADRHQAADPEKRRSYTHDLGRALHRDNAGALQWGAAYRDFHARAWAEAVRVLRPGGVLVLNVKDHIRGGAVQPVAEWHAGTLAGLGLDPIAERKLRTGGLDAGANADTRRALPELLLVFRKADR